MALPAGKTERVISYRGYDEDAEMAARLRDVLHLKSPSEAHRMGLRTLYEIVFQTMLSARLRNVTVNTVGQSAEFVIQTAGGTGR